ncbi:hypothetical protein SRHO_G00005340 [Serrasalmus rhombeus]
MDKDKPTAANLLWITSGLRLTALAPWLAPTLCPLRGFEGRRAHSPKRPDARLRQGRERAGTWSQGACRTPCRLTLSLMGALTASYVSWACSVVP